MSCHGPSVEELKEDLVKTEPTYWLKSHLPAPFDRRFLKTPLFDLATIGTDPAQAADFASRFALVPDPFPLETKNALEDLGPRQLGKGGPTQPSRGPRRCRPGHDHRLGREGLAGRHRGNPRAGLQGRRAERCRAGAVGPMAPPPAEYAGQGHPRCQCEVQGPPA